MLFEEVNNGYVFKAARDFVCHTGTIMR